MLPRAYSYKPRKRTGEELKIRVNNTIRKGRTLDYLKQYLEIHPKANIVEMDTVIGKFEDKKCIMKETILNYGIPECLYTDYRTIFKSNKKRINFRRRNTRKTNKKH